MLLWWQSCPGPLVRPVPIWHCATPAPGELQPQWQGAKPCTGDKLQTLTLGWKWVLLGAVHASQIPRCRARWGAPSPVLCSDLPTGYTKRRGRNLSLPQLLPDGYISEELPISCSAGKKLLFCGMPGGCCVRPTFHSHATWQVARLQKQMVTPDLKPCPSGTHKQLCLYF